MASINIRKQGTSEICITNTIGLQALREVDYEVRDKHLLEKVLNFESQQLIDRSVFYNGLIVAKELGGIID